MSADQLFTLSTPTPGPDPTEGMSAGQKLTWRQRARIAQGLHPLSITCGHITLHADAAPGDNRQATGLRCGTCVFRINHGAHSYPKCNFGDGIRISHGQATDCRAWWPACTSYKAAS